ncbi:DUF2065 domain-containing protein [Aquibium microcysteis]|uniref:DUF2065 domain-containing protein n=1 Tax=Aquibium microcysteis TaxID=675281 RepID=UPI00165D10A1|nr:DUF2065 family protein [Aquibium microcysteis]
MRDLIDALGLVLVIEGLIYGGFPSLARRLASNVLDMSDDTLRYGGIAAVAVGVGIVWLVRG